MKTSLSLVYCSNTFYVKTHLIIYSYRLLLTNKTSAQTDNKQLMNCILAMHEQPCFVSIIKYIYISKIFLKFETNMQTCWITLTRSLRTVLRRVLLVMTAVVRYLSICGHMVCMAFKYSCEYKNMSIMRSRPLGWLKNTNKLQWISQVRCCSDNKALPNVWKLNFIFFIK